MFFVVLSTVILPSPAGYLPGGMILTAAAGATASVFAEKLYCGCRISFFDFLFVSGDNAPLNLRPCLGVYRVRNIAV